MPTQPDNGPDKRRARINEAEAIIEKLHYKGERYMTFEKFVTKLKKCMSSLPLI
jgi:hypothetical protein